MLSPSHSHTHTHTQVTATLPFGVLSSASFHLVVYGMTGLRHGAGAAARSCVLGVLGYLIGAQVGGAPSKRASS